MSNITFAKEILKKISDLAKKNPLEGEKASEILRSFEQFSEKCLKIKTTKGIILPFVLNTAQRKLAREIFEAISKGKAVRIIILKARQLGFSTLAEAIVYYLTSLQEAKNSYIVAHEDEAVNNLFDMFKLYYEKVPTVYKPMKKHDNSKKLTFENPTSFESDKKRNPGLKSKITVASAEKKSLGRSGTIHYLHISELAFWPENRQSKHMLSLLQALSDAPGTLCIVESTANGIGEYFQQMWEKAVKGENDYTPIFVGWHENSDYSESFSSTEEEQIFEESLTKEERDMQQRFNLSLEQLKWRRSTIKNKCGGDPKAFQQEYPAYPEEAFLVSGRSSFDQEQIKKDMFDAVTPIRIENEGDILVWEDPLEGELYDMGADVAEGLDDDDHDSSTFSIRKRSTGEKVAECQCKEEPFQFANILDEWGHKYNNALLGVERNNHGHAVLAVLIHNHDYPNLYYHADYDSKTKEMQKRPGWPTTPKTRPILVENYRQDYKEGEIDVPSKRQLSEMRTFIKKNGKHQHQVGCHDDILIADMICWEMRKYTHKGQIKAYGFSIMPDLDSLFA